MRKIEYIFIDSDTQNDNRKSGRPAVPDLRYHYVIDRRSCRNPTDIQRTVDIIQGPIYDPDKYNRSSIFIRYCGILTKTPLTLNSEPSRAALLQLLVSLRKHFPEARILGVSEIDGRELYCKNVIVSDAMNVLRRELSEQ